MRLKEFTISENRVQPTPQPWGDLSRDNSAENIYKTAREMAETSAKILNRKLQRLASDHKIIINLKKESSFLDKINNRGRNASDITDVLRSTILVNDASDLEKVIKSVQKSFEFSRLDRKLKKSDPEYGYYGPVHIIIKVGEIWAEIQIMPKQLWPYKKAAHKLYVKHRSGDASNAEQDKQHSKQMYGRGNIERSKSDKKPEYQPSISD